MWLSRGVPDVFWQVNQSELRTKYHYYCTEADALEFDRPYVVGTDIVVGKPQNAKKSTPM